MSTKQPSNAFKLTYSKSGDGSFFYSFAEDLPKEKKPAFAVRLGTNSLKTAFRAYLINKEIRKEVFSTTKNAHHMSLLTMNENFKIIVNMNLAQAVIKKFFPSEYLVLDRNHLKKVLWSVYTELNEIRDNIEADFFFEEEMEQFEDALLFRKCLKLVENDEFQVEENSVYPTYASNMPNACTQPSLVSSPLIVPDGALVSTHDIRPDYKYPQKSSKFSIYEEPPKEVDTDSLNITKKQEVETVDGKQAWKSQHGESSVSQAEQSIDTYIDLILKSFIVPDTSGESRNLPGTKYPRTSDKLSSSEATTMEVDTDSSNETKKQEVEKVDGKQAGKSQHGKRSVSQAEQRIDTYIDFILKPFIVPDTSGESRKLPGRKYPRTSDKISICKPTTKEVDTDSLNETKKQEVEMVEDKQAGKSQLGDSVSQSMQNADTHPHLIPNSVRDKSGESRTQPGRKYPLTIDKLSSCKPTTMEVDNDSLNRTKKHEVETVEDKQAGKSQLGGNSVSQICKCSYTHLIQSNFSTRYK
ncbi:hypothetical protein TNCT_519261 [Trichonephila clavata]|uniref:Uncharacterized protein n=1 Tax=Trichonephila clavata TaxID=2740835 RepID=A0A8X6KSH7_TRICU|nr:hypothetical protein TNCT_519261 [Trichonephila clavata]